MGEFFSKVHRDLPPTRQWGYDGTSPGPTFETRTGQPISVEWVNNLPQKHFLPIDHNIMGAEKDKPEVRAIVSTGYDNEDMNRKFIEMGFCGYLTKPYRVTDLGKTLKAVLG